MFLVFSQGVSAEVETTTLCIRNTTNRPHHIEVANIENYDWEGDNRPDHNFNKVTIEAGQSICRLENTNPNAQPNFTFVIEDIPTRISIFNNGWGAYSVPSPGKTTNLWGEKTNWATAWNYYRAYGCNIGVCYLFEIR
jgi:hypothetical protein